MIAPENWRAALELVDGSRRTLVLGGADVGKSSFIREALDRRGDLRLIDLDPGQKMLGPPGTVALSSGGGAGVERFVFTGSTSASTLRTLTVAAGRLADAADGPVIANTSGFVRGLGAKLQSLTTHAMRPDLVVGIERETELEPILSAVTQASLVRIRPSLLARRKSGAERRRRRRSALNDALARAERLRLPPETPFAPAPPLPLTGAGRPLCALTDAAGEDMSVGVLEKVLADGIFVLAPPPPREVQLIKLGRMWAEPGDEDWTLLERLTPAWAAYTACPAAQPLAQAHWKL